MSSNTVAIIEMLSLFNQDCASTLKIMQATGLARTTVQRYIRMLRRRKLLRIAEWHKHGRGGGWNAWYAWNTNDDPDTPKPSPLTRAQIDARRRNKPKAYRPL